ncbi:hypothetical protein UXP54_12555, partial [Enterobacter hormaechei]
PFMLFVIPRPAVSYSLIKPRIRKRGGHILDFVTRPREPYVFAQYLQPAGWINRYTCHRSSFLPGKKGNIRAITVMRTAEDQFINFICNINK